MTTADVVVPFIVACFAIACVLAFVNVRRK